MANQPPQTPSGQPPQPWSTDPPPQWGTQQPGAPQPAASNNMAIAALVCSLVGLVLFGIILGPLGIIFGSIAIKNGENRGMALAGIIVGALDVILFFLVLNHYFRFVS